jgi:CAAX prenyl protease-like protein
MASKRIAYTAPFVTFMLFTGLSGLLDSLHLMPGGIAGRYWLYPLQTIVCAALLVWLWPQYELRSPRKPWLAVAVGLLVFILWISPQALPHAVPRRDGFNPNVFATQPGAYWASLLVRTARLVIVVPILEEVFWRGFLLPVLISDHFETVPFGTYNRAASAVVALGFMLEHQFPDWPAGLAAGILYNTVAFRTRSLGSCILAHALTNALLGAWIMHTGQWGFW